MGRKSSVKQLPAKILALVEQLIRDGRTIDEILEQLHGLDAGVSRSAVGRFKQGYEASLARYREAQEVAGGWAAMFTENPESDVGRLIAEMLKTLAFQTMAQMGEEEEPVDPQSLMFLGKAINDVTRATQINEKRLADVEAKAKKEAAKIAETVARTAGLSDDMVQEFRKKILGIT